MKISEIKTAQENNRITYIEDLTQFEGFSEEDNAHCPILIQYGGGSEAEVYLTEIQLA
jgi:hypothetical protein